MMKFQTPKGTRDLLPEEASKFQNLIKNFKNVAEKYGFKPLITPAFETFELLAAKGGLGESVKNEIYYFKDKSDRELGLRFDMTMPLARVISSNPQIPKPFKRYVVDKVWRYDNPQAMRWREFWQADIDTVGAAGLDADAEIIAFTCEFLKEIGFEDFKIRASDRRIIQGFLESIQVSNWKDVTISIDKKEKIGEEKVKEELKTKGLNSEQIKKIFAFLNSDATFAANESFANALDELKKLKEKVGEYGFGKYFDIDLSLVRGLEYYTSFVYEVNLGSAVSCGGGGRYDNLIAMVGGNATPATGISFGMDRVFEVMKEKKMLDSKSGVEVFVANVNENMKSEAIKISQRLRKDGVNCQTDLMNRNLTKQLEYADSSGIPFVVIVGERELKNKKVKIRNMKTKKEKDVLISKIKENLD